MRVIGIVAFFPLLYSFFATASILGGESVGPFMLDVAACNLVR